MARNRKNQTAAMRFGPAIMAFVFCALIAGAGLNYVWQKDQIGKLGRQIARDEQRLQELRADNQRLNARFQQLISSKVLEARVLQMNLGLSAPREDQILRLREEESPTAPSVALAKIH